MTKRHKTKDTKKGIEPKTDKKNKTSNKSEDSLLKVVAWIFAVALFLFLITFGFYSIVLNQNIYQKEFNVTKVYENYNDKSLVDQKNAEVLNYIQGINKNLDESFFNQREIEHLNDVKRVFSTLYIISFFATIFTAGFLMILIVKKKWKYILNACLFSSLGVIIFMIILLIASAINFNSSFNFFHSLFFQAGTWVFNSQTDNLVKLYPTDFFINMSKLIFYRILSMAILIFNICLFIKLKIKLNELKKMEKQYEEEERIEEEKKKSRKSKK